MATGPFDPPVRNQAFTFYVSLQDMKNPGSFLANPTITAGKVQVQQDGGALANLGTTPSVAPASSIWVKVQLSAAEMNGDNIAVQFIDTASPKLWADYSVNILTTAATVVRNGTAQAGSASTITLDAGASATNNLYQDCIVFIWGGTGAGQARSIQSYVGSTQVATVFPNWTTNPDSTSIFTIYPFSQVDVGNWVNGTVPAPATAGIPDINVKNWDNQAATVDANNAPNVSAKYWAGTAITASSIPVGTAAGASGGLLVAGSNAATTFASGSHFIGTVDTVTTVTNQLTGAAIATAVWTDTTSSDFTTTSSPGKIIVAQLGGAFTTVSSSVFSSAALANTPVTSAPTVAQIATAVWQDTTVSDFTTAGSIGKSLYTSGNAPGAASGLALVGSNVGTATSVTGAVGSVTGNVGGNVVGSVGSVTGNVGGNVVGSVGSISGITFPTNFGALGITIGGKVSEVVLVDTLTTYTNDTPQSGDSFARIGVTGSGLTSLAPSATALSTANWTNARSAYLDNLNVGGAVASHADAVALSAAIAALPQMTGSAPTWYTTPPTASAVALAYLVYDMSTVVGEAAKSPVNCLRKLRDWSISGNTLTVYKEDGSTAAYTQTLTTANASPITAITG